MPDTKQEKFMEMYRPCHEPFLRYCSALAYGKMDTEDLVQDVLLSAFIHFEGLRNPKEFLHYLIRAARNRSISLWRKRKKQAELTDKYAERLSAKGIHAETLLDIDYLYKALNQLPKTQKEAIILFEVSGFSIKEIAELQKSSPGAVKTRLSRGRKQLKKLLDDSPALSQSSQNLFSIIQTVIL
ncbi:MAG: RNA polymerase sigma factor [Bacteroidota bacterium]